MFSRLSVIMSVCLSVPMSRSCSDIDKEIPTDRYSTTNLWQVGTGGGIRIIEMLFVCLLYSVMSLAENS